MVKYFLSYCWKDGVPVGCSAVQEDKCCEEVAAYNIVSDPYRKRFSIEKHVFGRFQSVIYDSHLLDFRHLTLEAQAAWLKETLFEDSERTVVLIRDQDHRAILMETHHYQGGYCRTCSISSVHGIPLCTRILFCEERGDAFNGFVLEDLEQVTVMSKRYAVEDGCFVDLKRPT